jgi:hypothetical protein
MARIIAYACLAISGSLAAVYGYTTGSSELYGLLRALGWSMVAVVGGCSPAWFFHHVDAKSYGRAFVTILAGAICFCVTIYGSMGGITGSSDKVIAERSKLAEATKGDRADLRQITAERAKLPDFRPIGTVQADIEVVRAGRAYKLSDGCHPEKIAAKAIREACEAFRKLEGELEAGRAAARLDEAAGVIRARLATGAAVQTVDPGAAAVSQIVGASTERVAAWSALLGSLALELAGVIAMMRAESAPPARVRHIATDATQAPAAALTARRVPRRQRTIAGIALIGPPKPAAIADADTVGEFMLGCLRRASGEKVAGDAIYTRYQRWCSEQRPSVPPLDLRTFAQQFAKRCKRIDIRTRRDGGKVYCVGVQLVA